MVKLPQQIPKFHGSAIYALIQIYDVIQTLYRVCANFIDK